MHNEIHDPAGVGGKIAKTTRRRHSNLIIDKQFHEVGGLKFFFFFRVQRGSSFQLPGKHESLGIRRAPSEIAHEQHQTLQLTFDTSRPTVRRQEIEIGDARCLGRGDYLDSVLEEDVVLD